MSGRQAPADLARKLVKEVDIVGALWRPADQFIDLMGVWPDQNAPLVGLDPPLRMIVAASAALVAASSRKRRSRSATRCRISSSDMAEASLPIEAKRARACASCVASIASA